MNFAFDIYAEIKLHNRLYRLIRFKHQSRDCIKESETFVGFTCYGGTGTNYL